MWLWIQSQISISTNNHLGHSSLESLDYVVIISFLVDSNLASQSHHFPMNHGLTSLPRGYKSQIQEKQHIVPFIMYQNIIKRQRFCAFKPSMQLQQASDLPVLVWSFSSASAETYVQSLSPSWPSSMWLTISPTNWDSGWAEAPPPSELLMEETVSRFCWDLSREDFGIRERRQRGQVVCKVSQRSIQSMWKVCPHGGICWSFSFAW